MAASTTQVAIRFRTDDLQLIEAIQAKTGISTRTDVLRMAIRKFAAAEGVALVATPPTKKPPTVRAARGSK